MAVTYAQGWSKTAAGMKAFNALYSAAGVTASTNFVTLVSAFQTVATLTAPDEATALNSFATLRQQIRSLITKPSAELNPSLGATAASSLVGSTRSDQTGQIDDIYSYMVGASPAECVTSRGFVRGAWSAAGGNTGNGTFKRIWVDAYGWPMEVGFAEVYKLKCTADQGLGVPFKGREQWSVSGLPFQDELTWTSATNGSGLSTFANAVNADDSLLLNASFSATPTGGDATPSGATLAGWTVSGGLVGDGTDILVDRVNYYQEAAVDSGSPAALRFTTTKTIYQLLKGSGSNNIPITMTSPWYGGIFINPHKNGQWTGTVVITLGSKSWTKTITTQGDAWIEVSPDVNDAASDQTNTWYANWTTDGAKFQIAVTKTSGATTYLMVARALLLPYRAVADPQTGGTMFFMLPLSGSTPWRVNDTGTITDSTVDSGSVIQQWSHRTWGTYWSSRPAAPTTVPVVAQSAAAGVITVGNHYVAYSHVSVDGVEGPIGPPSLVVAADGAHKLDVSNVLAGPANIASRKVYLVKAGVANTGPFYYAGATGLINDNVTTTVSINVADGSLSVIPQVISIAEP